MGSISCDGYFLRSASDLGIASSAFHTPCATKESLSARHQLLHEAGRRGFFPSPRLVYWRLKLYGSRLITNSQKYLVLTNRGSFASMVSILTSYTPYWRGDSIVASFTSSLSLILLTLHDDSTNFFVNRLVGCAELLFHSPVTFGKSSASTSSVLILTCDPHSHQTVIFA